MSPSEVGATSVTGVVLAGGRGTRLGGGDKGLELFRGYPLIVHVLARLGPQVDALYINANRHEADYAALGYPVITDCIAGFAGPLAGLHAAMLVAQTPLVASVPCDAPYFPLDLVSHLKSALEANAAQVAVARTCAGVQPVFMLAQRDLVTSVASFLGAGERKVGLWLQSVRCIQVDFGDEQAFVNLNSHADIAAATGRNSNA